MKTEIEIELEKLDKRILRLRVLMIIGSIIFCAYLLTGCSSVKWGGCYGGVQNVSQFRESPSRDSGSGYVNCIWLLPHDCSFQVEPILPFNRPEQPLLRVAFDHRFF